MPVTNPFQGEKGANIRGSRWSEIIFAPRGIAFAGAALKKGLRDSLEVNIKPSTTPHVTGGLLVNNYDAIIKGRFYETTFDRLHAMYMLIRDFHQVRVMNMKGEYLSFVDDTSEDFDDPEGTELVGATMKFVVEPTARYIDYEGKTQMTHQQAVWLVDNFGAGHAGLTGGTNVFATGAETYDRDKYGVPNFHEIWIGDGGVDDADQAAIGIFREGKLELSFEAMGGDDHKGRPIPDICKIRGEALMRQVAGADILAGITSGQSDKVVQFKLMTGEQVYLNLAASAHVEWTLGDKEMSGKLIVQGDAPFNINEGAPNSLDIGVTDAKILRVNRIGY